MRFRKLRIAWSGGCGIACVLLIALWVRSFNSVDSAQLPLSHSLASVRGRILLDRPVGLAQIPYTAPVSFPIPRFGIVSASLDSFVVTTGSGGAAVPFWAAALFSAILVSTFWIPDRFS